MAKKNEDAGGVFSDDVLAKLKAAKKELVQKQQKQEEEKEAERQFERREREKNLSFEELLERHGDKGNKF